MVTELTVQQRLDYWKRKIGIGSVWLLQDFNTAYLTVNVVSFDSNSKAIVVEYSMKETPGLIHTSEVGYFLEYIVHSRVK